MTKSQQTAQAKILGGKAFQNGLRSAPCLDKDLMALIVEQAPKIGTSAHILKAWLSGWTSAVLAGEA